MSRGFSLPRVVDADEFEALTKLACELAEERDGLRRRLATADAKVLRLEQDNAALAARVQELEGS